MSDKLKVMQIMPEFRLAGAEIMAENLSVMLTEEGADCCVVSLYDYHSPITERLQKKNIRIYFLGKKRGFDTRIYYKLYRLIKKEKPVVVHSHLYSIIYSAPAALLAGVSAIIHTIHNIASKELGRLHRAFCHILYNLCRVIPVALSHTIQKTVMEEYGLPKVRVPVIYNGIDLSKCVPKVEQSEKGSTICILHIGRFSRQKNHLTLIDVFKKVHDMVPNTVLYLIGTGEMEKLVKDRVDQLELADSVQFLGLQPNVYNFLSEADIFILPSLWEGMPITLIEAMATGLAIVATSVGGVPDMIEDEVTGLLVSTNVDDIAGSILRLISDRDLRQKLGDAARKSAEQFSAREMAIKYMNLYKSMI